MTYFGLNQQISYEEAYEKAKILHKISGARFRPYTRDMGERSYWSFKGMILGFDVTVWIDTGDGLWHATTSAFNQVINSWTGSFDKVMELFIMSLHHKMLYEADILNDKIEKLYKR